MGFHWRKIIKFSLNEDIKLLMCKELELEKTSEGSNYNIKNKYKVYLEKRIKAY